MTQLKKYFTSWLRQHPSARRAWLALLHFWYEWKLQRQIQTSITNIDAALRSDPILKKLGVQFIAEHSRFFVKEVSGLRAVWAARGGHIEASTLRSEMFEVPADVVGFHVYEFEDKLDYRHGDPQVVQETWQKIEELAVTRVRNEILERIVRLLQAAQPEQSDEILAAIWSVYDKSPSAQLTIVGRYDAIEECFAQESAHKRFNKNFAMVDLAGILDDEDRQIGDDRVYVAAPGAFEFALWDGPKHKYYADDNWYAHLIMRWDFGGVICRTDRLKMIKAYPEPISLDVQGASDLDVAETIGRALRSQD